MPATGLTRRALLGAFAAIGHLLDLFHAWTPDRQPRRRILVDTPARLFGK